MYKEKVLKRAFYLRGMAKSLLLVCILLAIVFIYVFVATPMPIGAGRPFELLVYAIISLLCGFSSYFSLQAVADISTSLVLTDEEKLKEESKQ